VIVGGRTTPYAEHLAREWKRWVVHLSQHTIDEMPAIVAAAHVVVVPQRDTATARAQCPMKLTDGMAMAKPVLSTRVGDIPAVLGDTGWLVAPSRPDALRDALAAILGDAGAAAAQGARARERCVERYGLRAAAHVLEPLLHGVRRS
jgi:glycosyltransferase involved in cell wall biosynthesis